MPIAACSKTSLLAKDWDYPQALTNAAINLFGDPVHPIRKFHEAVLVAVDVAMGRRPKSDWLPIRQRAFALSDDDLDIFEAWLYRQANYVVGGSQAAVNFSNVFSDVVISVHQEQPLQDATAKLLGNRSTDSLAIVVASQDFPQSEKMLASRPHVFISKDGELPRVIARQATLVGGHCDSCLLTSLAQLIANAHAAGIAWPVVAIRANLSYPREDFSSLGSFFKAESKEAERVMRENLTFLVEKVLPRWSNGRSFKLVVRDSRPSDLSVFSYQVVDAERSHLGATVRIVP